MKAVLLELTGNWAQFRRAETNNNPLSHDLITKIAFMGMIGAVLGIERKEMRALFPIWSEDYLYGVQILNDVNKQSWGFTLRKAGDAWSKAPGQMEFIKNPKYKVVLALVNVRSLTYFEKFIESCKTGDALFEPIFGLHNCPAEIKFIEEGEIIEINDSDFETVGFVTNRHSLVDAESLTGRLGFDNIPTYQNDDFWNVPEKFVPVIYPSSGSSIKVHGNHYDFSGKSKWCLI